MSKKDLKSIKDLFKELEGQAEELINFGDSKEKAEGYGMLRVTKEIYNYCKRNKIKI